MSETSTFFPLGPGQMGGAITVNVFAILSALALFSVILRVGWLGVRRILRDDIAQTRERVFFNTQLGYYAACLLFANMFNSIAGLLGVPSLKLQGIYEDATCITQATMMQFGNISTAYYTIAIAVHTFNSLVIRKRQSVIVSILTISLGWVIAAIICTFPFYISQPRGPIYGVEGLSCGVRATYGKEQFLLHLLPIFLTAFFSAILYAFIFLVLRGTLVVKGGVKIQLDPQQRWTVREDQYHRFMLGIARSMCWYPVAYVVCLVPYSVTRLLALSGYVVPFEAMIFAFTCWFMLGVVNVLLLYNTFRVLTPAFATKIASDGKDVENYGSEEKLAPPSSPVSSPFLHSDMSSGFHGSSSNSNSPTSQGPFMTSPPRAVSISSYYNYNSPGESIPTVGRNIASPELIERMMTPDPIRSLRSTPAPALSRDNSSSSLISLPAPPRPTRPPHASRQPSVDRPSPINTSLGMEGGKVRFSQGSIGGGNSGTRDSDASLDLAGWLAQQRPDGSMPRMKNMPALSAVTPDFPSTETDNRSSTIESPSRLRPLLLAPSSTQSPVRDARFGTIPNGSPRSVGEHSRLGSASSAQFF